MECERCGILVVSTGLRHLALLQQLRSRSRRQGRGKVVHGTVERGQAHRESDTNLNSSLLQLRVVRRIPCGETVYTQARRGPL